MRGARASELRPEFVFLGLLADGPCHGYRLYQAFRETFAGLWRISESQMYATLARLHAKGWITETAGDPDAPAGDAPQPSRSRGRSRQALALTPAGRAAFQEWLERPGAVGPRSLRLEFLSRLRFAGLRPEGALAARLVREQREVVAAELERSEGRAAANGEGRRDGGPPAFLPIDQLSADFRLRQLRAALGWLLDLEREIR